MPQDSPFYRAIVHLLVSRHNLATEKHAKRGYSSPSA